MHFRAYIISYLGDQACCGRHFPVSGQKEWEGVGLGVRRRSMR